MDRKGLPNKRRDAAKTKVPSLVLWDFVREVVTLPAVIRTGLVSFVAFGTGQRAVVLRVRIGLPARFEFFFRFSDHCLIVAVAARANAVVTVFFEGAGSTGVTGVALQAAFGMTIGKHALR